MTTLHLMLAFVLCGLGAGCLMLYWFTSVSPNFPTAYRPFAVFGTCSFLAGLTIALISVFYRNWLLTGRRNTLLRIVEILLIGGSSILFAFAGQKIPASIFGIVAGMITIATFWEARKPLKQLAIVNAKGITIPGKGVSKTIHWREVEHVLLRHGILTIELSRNRLIQRSVATNHTDPQSLEAFSKGLIASHEKERLANVDW